MNILQQTPMLPFHLNILLNLLFFYKKKKKI
jgi:hypothetical protein